MDLVEQVGRTVDRHGMLARGSTVVVAVSGGQDSIALLHVLHTLRDAWAISLVAAHLDHGFRGPDSAADAGFVRDFCLRLGIPCRVAYEDVPEQKKRLHLSSQEAARRARHAFLRTVARDVGAERIALGHTRDDRVETILLNILRGTGPDGLEGFPAVRLPLIRPLYDAARSDTHDYCLRNALQPRSDASNDSLSYRRNRLRHELLPYLAEHYNPRVREALLRLSDLAAAESELLDQLSREALDSVALEQTPNELTLASVKLHSLPAALRRRVLRLAISRQRGDLHGVEQDVVERVLESSRRGERLALRLPGSGSAPCYIGTRDQLIYVLRQAASAETLPWRVDLPAEGRIGIPGGSAIECCICESTEEARTRYRKCLDAAAACVIQGALLLRLSEVRLPLVARSWRPGDRMRPRGLNGTKKLQDLFVDRKIPVERRSLIPVIEEGESQAAADESPAEDSGDRLPRILGVLGLQGGESSVPLDNRTGDTENIGPCALIMALSHTGIT